MTTPTGIDWGPLVLQTLAAAVLSGSVVGIALKAIIDRRFERRRINREWKEKVLSVLLGPLAMHFLRTDAISAFYKKTFNQKTKSYIYAMLLRESNKAIRSLLIQNGHLMSGPLLGHAQALLKHYDVWLAWFDEKETTEKPGPDSTFDMGFVEVRFPIDARDSFMREYASLRKELYGDDSPNPTFLRNK